MGTRYRSWAERRQIISAIIAETQPPPLESFSLSPSEEVFFRARSKRAVARLARQTATFKAYYSLRTTKPFLYILGVTGLVVTFGIAAGLYLAIRGSGNIHLYPLLAACATITVAAIGWCVGAWIAHRNAVRQNTTNMIFARFSQAVFADSIHRFHDAFGNRVEEKVSTDMIRALKAKGGEDAKAGESAIYLLNYYEFISAGVMRGDLDAQIINDNIKGVLCFYYDKCEPHVLAANRRNPKIFEHLMKLRTHYREP